MVPSLSWYHRSYHGTITFIILPPPFPKYHHCFGTFAVSSIALTMVLSLLPPPFPKYHHCFANKVVCQGTITYHDTITVTMTLWYHQSCKGTMTVLLPSLFHQSTFFYFWGTVTVTMVPSLLSLYHHSYHDNTTVTILQSLLPRYYHLARYHHCFWYTT